MKDIATHSLFIIESIFKFYGVDIFIDPEREKKNTFPSIKDKEIINNFIILKDKTLPG